LVDEGARDVLRAQNTPISKLNTLLQHLTANSPRLFFADHSNLTQDGQFRRDLHIGDGMHPNNEGNRLLASNLRTAVLNALKKQQATADATPASAAH
jgi:lysophospholipase L1-like esterase